ncbi:MAG: MerR family transcriptional regulator [Candidatus Omnitrophica bacterium]|nr:MerR family transcriptional regulator [Candidatus Omnitrophota bacterium]
MAVKLVSSKEIIKRHHIPYFIINYYTKKGVFKVVKKEGNRRLYSLEEIETRLKEKGVI